MDDRGVWSDEVSVALTVGPSDGSSAPWHRSFGPYLAVGLAAIAAIAAVAVGRSGHRR